MDLRLIFAIIWTMNRHNHATITMTKHIRLPFIILKSFLDANIEIDN